VSGLLGASSAATALASMVEEYGDVFRDLDFQSRSPLRPVIDEVERAVAQTDWSLFEFEDSSVAVAEDEQEAQEFATALKAFIAAGLVGRHFTSATFLMTVRRCRTSGATRRPDGCWPPSSLSPSRWSGRRG
jgi:hypothetical protein